MAQKIAVHSCIVSHIECDFNRLIEPDLRIYVCARPRLGAVETVAPAEAGINLLAPERQRTFWRRKTMNETQETATQILHRNAKESSIDAVERRFAASQTE
jgi:hypothetical protein